MFHVEFHKKIIQDRLHLLFMPANGQHMENPGASCLFCFTSTSNRVVNLRELRSSDIQNFHLIQSDPAIVSQTDAKPKTFAQATSQDRGAAQPSKKVVKPAAQKK